MLSMVPPKTRQTSGIFSSVLGDCGGPQPSALVLRSDSAATRAVAGTRTRASCFSSRWVNTAPSSLPGRKHGDGFKNGCPVKGADHNRIRRARQAWFPNSCLGTQFRETPVSRDGGNFMACAKQEFRGGAFPNGVWERASWERGIGG